MARRGYTLTELLIVISIIAALGAILIPIAGVIQSSARQSGCLSNIRQIGLADLCYSVENRGYLMPSSSGNANTTIYWTTSIEDYLPARTQEAASKSVFQCPQARTEFPAYTGFFSGNSTWKGSNYAMNPNLHPIYRYQPVRRTQILRPAEIVSVMESGVDITTSGSIELQGVDAGIYDNKTIMNQVSDGPNGVSIWFGNNNQDNQQTNNGSGGATLFSSRLCPRWRHGRNLRGVALFADGHGETRDRSQTFMLHFVNAY